MDTRSKVRSLYKKGLTYGQICEKLSLAKGTVSYHCSDLAAKWLKKKVKATKKRKEEELKINLKGSTT